MEDTSSKETEEALQTKDIYEILHTALEKIGNVADSSKNLEAELRQMHKLYHNEFRTILDSMEKELKHYRSLNEGSIFDEILSDLSKLYAENMDIPATITDEALKTRLDFLFEDLLQILESRGVSMRQSEIGESRDLLRTLIRQKIPTDKPELHGMIAASHGASFSRETKTFVKERVDVYIYDREKQDGMDVEKPETSAPEGNSESVVENEEQENGQD